MIVQTKETQQNMTPEKAIVTLKEGNKRFVNNLRLNRDLLRQAGETSAAQFPFATILSCIDSRVPVELVFDQGLGDVFSIRIAGNFVNKDILGSMEFGCKVAGSKLLLVLGHTQCGAVKGACDNVDIGNLGTMLRKIQPAIEGVSPVAGERNSKNEAYVQQVAEKNVSLTIQRIVQESPLLREMVQEGELLIKGAMYDVKTGSVTFL